VSTQAAEQNAEPYSASVLIVDDEAANVRLMQKTLASAGYADVAVTQDPRTVVSLCQDRRFDLVILDLNMPYLDGFQVMEQLNLELGTSGPAILVLTAQHGRDARIRALQNGARDFVGKPFDRIELLARVRNLIEVQLAQRSMRSQNELLELKVRERTQMLQQSRLQVVQRLGRAAEYRDNETGLHIIRMSNMSALLAHEAGLDSYQCDLLLNASPMHDIGKIGIPDHILLKPGKLEPHEWEVMKTHTLIGADLLAGDDSDLMILAHDIALTHHEKWDGSGYPHGLAGEDIPPAGRIVALADVFDALTSERPYKPAWPVERAVALIREQAGRHFDPELAEVFLSVLPRVLAISNQYAEPDAPADTVRAGGGA
jgi:putative two-component system response regulator